MDCRLGKKIGGKRAEAVEAGKKVSPCNNYTTLLSDYVLQVIDDSFFSFLKNKKSE